MKIAVCKHGNETGIIIESSIDYQESILRAHAYRLPCEECTNEALAELVRSYITTGTGR